MFVGRKKELKYLDEFYKKPNIGMMVVYGRRRIGKSTLINEFVKNKKYIYYTATKIGNDRNLEFFSNQVVNFFEPNISGLKFSSIEAIFDYISEKIADDKVIMVIDELPYWAQKNEALLSILQKYIDTKWLGKNLKIILCGSSLSFMEDKVLSEKSPLFGRRDSQIKLDVFDFYEASEFVSNYTTEDKAICYGITGGVAKYLSMIDPNISLDENIINQFFKPNGYLYDETRNLLTQEFQDITLVNNIIEQVASGENTVNAIASKVKESESTVLYSLERLISVGLLEKKKCITEEKNKKKTQYILKDYMFKFWYQFVPNAVSVIELGSGELYYQKVVKNNIHLFMGSVFEGMCQYYTLVHSLNGEYGAFVTKVGSWWGNVIVKNEDGSKTGRPIDIDVVALSNLEKKVVIGECKFKNEKVDKAVYDTLVTRSSIFTSNYEISKLIIFSLSGFSSWFENNNLENVELITLDDMYANRIDIK